MQLNGGLRKVRNIRAILIAAVFALAGIAFVAFGIYFLVHPTPDEATGKTSPLGGIAFIVMGSVAILSAVFSVRRSIQTMRNSKPLSEEEVLANEAALDEGAPSIPNLIDIKLFFHFGGKLNQSFFVEDRNGKVVYECRLKKFSLLGANTFEFTDVENSYSKIVKIGKTVSTESDGGLPLVGDTLSSRFKIDGVVCWDYLHSRGYEIKHYVLDRFLMRYELVKLDKVVAEILPANMKDPWNEECRNFLRMPKGSYRLEIRDAKLEDVVMAAFIIYQTEIVE